MDPDFDVEKEWLVSYFPEPTQELFQQAYDRLHGLHSWLAHPASHELHMVAKRLLSAHLSTMQKVSFVSED
jgi:hypothetical protein